MAAKISATFTAEAPLVELEENRFLPKFSGGDTVEGRVFFTVPDTFGGFYSRVYLKYWLSSELKLHYYRKNEVQMQQSSTKTPLTEDFIVPPTGEDVVLDGMRTHTFTFSFPKAALPTDSYYGFGCSLRFLLSVTGYILETGGFDMSADFEFMVVNHQPQSPLEHKYIRIDSELPSKCKIAVNFFKNTYGIEDSMRGTVSGKVDKCYIESLILIIGVKETIYGVGDEPVVINEEVGEFDYYLGSLRWTGDSFRGDFDFSLRRFSLTPSYHLVHGVFSVEYDISLRYRVGEKAEAEDWEVQVSVVDKGSDEDEDEESYEAYEIQTSGKKVTFVRR